MSKSEIDTQLDRINQIARTTGIKPSVLDVSAKVWETLCNEVLERTKKPEPYLTDCGLVIAGVRIVVTA